MLLGFRKLHSDLVYLNIKPIHFPFSLTFLNRNSKINLENQNTFWPTQHTPEKKAREYQNAPEYTQTHTIYATDNEVFLGFPFSGAEREEGEPNDSMRVLVLRCCCGEIFSVLRKPQNTLKNSLEIEAYWKCFEFETTWNLCQVSGVQTFFKVQSCSFCINSNNFKCCFFHFVPSSEIWPFPATPNFQSPPISKYRSQ